jgi:hypothetical protein
MRSQNTVTKDLTMLIEVLVKPADKLWDPSSVAYCLGHPTFFRRIGFRIRESCPEWKKCCDVSYGRTPDHPPEDIDSYDIYFGRLCSFDTEITDSMHHYTTRKEAIEHVKKFANGKLE